MKLKNAWLILFAALMVFCLSGCNTFSMDTDALITPPELSGNMAPISKALSLSVTGEYQLKYPSSGDRRSAIVLEDINGDGTFEAFAFYSTFDKETTTMHMNVIAFLDGVYRSVADMSIVAGGVEQIDFCDLDTDGTEEILVGWEIYGSSEKQICVYSLDGSETVQLLSEKYTGFICCDILGDETNQLLIQQLNTSELTNTATVYSLKKEGLKKIGSCVLDPEVKTASAPVLSTLSTGKNAVFIDEIKGAGAVTEVLVFRGGELKNPLLSTKNNIENIRTLRSASIQCKDINNDGVLEIPVATNLPNAAKSDELLYYTNWCAFDGKNLITRQITVDNTLDGYYLKIPDEFAGRLAVIKDTEKHRRVLYYYDTQLDEVGDRLVTITVVPKKQWDNKDFNRLNMFEIARNDTDIFAGAVNSTAKHAITEEQIREMFELN
ncbi:MAG: hypothetical protein J5852_03445 [Clostridia bacterium]|nr:hypothetical protein [Clostridia bacterium]